MQQINKIIQDYLRAENTDYAIMIKGEWGCGKSFYIDHGFKDVVEQIEVPEEFNQKYQKNTESNANRTYNVAYVSLYGLSSSSDFYHRVFCGINQWAKNGFVEFLGAGLSKAAGFFGVKADKEDIETITYIGSNQVLVFDDLERISEDKISIKEVLGLINKYSEHDKRKVIIVCNENYFLRDNTNDEIKSDYKEYKEKSIRFSYAFESNLSDVYDNMIGSLRDDDYRNCLNENKRTILKVFNIGGEKNLRTLKFFIDTFKQIYNEIIKTDSYKTELVNRLSTTLLIYAIEYKSGKSVEDLQLLNYNKIKIDTSFLSVGPKDSIGEKEQDYNSQFLSRYSEIMNDFYPCDVIIEYIVNGYLEVNQLSLAISNITNELIKQKHTPEGKVYRKLSCIGQIKDDEVKPCINEMMKYVEEDKYSIYDLLYIYVLLIKYNHMGVYTLTKKMTTKIRTAIRKQQNDHEYDYAFYMKSPIWDESESGTESYKLYTEMKTYAETINSEVKDKTEKSHVDEFIRLSESGNTNGLKEYRLDHELINLRMIDWKRIFKILDKASNPVAWELGDCLLFYLSRGRLVKEVSEIVTKELDSLISKLELERPRRVRYLKIKEIQNCISNSKY